MKNKLINFSDEFSKAIFTYYILLILHFSIYLIVGSLEEKFFTFSYLFFLFIWVFIFRFLYKSLFEQGYSYWLLTIIISGFLLKTLFVYTFLETNIIILYLCFLETIFIAANTYIMSSPLFFPRVQWWEYDFRYRGDLIVDIHHKDEIQAGRLTDLRRLEASIESFHDFKIEESLLIKVNFNEAIFKVNALIKTKKQIIPGRPYRYGVKIESSSEELKKDLAGLEKIWKKEKRAKMRRKFSRV